MISKPMVVQLIILYTVSQFVLHFVIKELYLCIASDTKYVLSEFVSELDESGS